MALRTQNLVMNAGDKTRVGVFPDGDGVNGQSMSIGPRDRPLLVGGADLTIENGWLLEPGQTIDLEVTVADPVYVMTPLITGSTTTGDKDRVQVMVLG